MFFIKSRQALTIITLLSLIYVIFSIKFYLEQNFVVKETKMKSSLNSFLNGNN